MKLGGKGAFLRHRLAVQTNSVFDTEGEFKQARFRVLQREVCMSMYKWVYQLPASTMYRIIKDVRQHRTG
jgi:hypothetical protein